MILLPRYILWFEVKLFESYHKELKLYYEDTYHDDPVLPGAADRGAEPLVALVVYWSLSVVVISGHVEVVAGGVEGYGSAIMGRRRRTSRQKIKFKYDPCIKGLSE